MKYIYTLIMIVCFAGFATANDSKSNLKYYNIILKEQGDTLLFSFDVEYNKQTVKSKQSLVVVPMIIAGGNTKTLPYIQFNGRNKSKTLKRTVSLKKNDTSKEQPYYSVDINKTRDDILNYEIMIPYESWMDKAELHYAEYYMGCAYSGDTELMAALSGKSYASVETMPKLPAIPPVTYVQPKPIVKERDEKGTAFLDFHKAKFDIDPTYRRNPEELMRIMTIVNKTSRDSDITIHNISIIGFASPEGGSAFNETLARNRANALKEYIQRMSGIPSHKFNVSSQGEDWHGFRVAVEEGNLRHKNQVLNILNNYDSFDRKKEQLKALGAGYHEILSDVFPGLRRSEYNIHYTVRDYSITEAQALLESDPSKLSSYELYLLAKQYERGSTQWNEIIELTIRMYPDDPEANINAAAVYINKEQYEKAKQCLDKVRNHPDAQNNIFIYEEMKRQGLLK